jgi:hypothetical protein
MSRKNQHPLNRTHDPNVPDYLPAQNLTGWIDLNRIGTGPKNSSTYLRGDDTWAELPTQANSLTVTVDFGASFSHFAQVVVADQSWVTADSNIVATPLAAAGEDVETALLQFSASVGSLVPGTGFTLSVYSPIEAKGTYTFSCVGV